MKNTKVTLAPLTADDREQFILDNQWAFKYGAMLEFGERDDHLDKAEHFIGTFIGITLICIGHRMVGLEIFTPKLVDLKTALVDVKMDIALLKIGSTGLPNLRFRMQGLYRKPRTVADALGVLLGRNE